MLEHMRQHRQVIRPIPSRHMHSVIRLDPPSSLNAPRSRKPRHPRSPRPTPTWRRKSCSC
jgi:hypothetical protein